MRWVPFVSRSVTVRPDEVAAGEGQNLAADPQVKSAFSFVEASAWAQFRPRSRIEPCGWVPQPTRRWAAPGRNQPGPQSPGAAGYGPAGRSTRYTTSPGKRPLISQAGSSGEGGFAPGLTQIAT